MREEIAKVVSDLNDKIFWIGEDQDYVLWFEHVSLPIGDYVKYAGKYIFDSENDYRPYDPEKEDEKQDLKEYLWEQMSLIKLFIYKSMKEIEKEGKV